MSGYAVSSDYFPELQSTQSTPHQRWKSLLRYELLLILTWVFIELARAYYIRKQSKDADEGDEESSKDKAGSSISWTIIIGAAIGVFLYWIIADLWLYSWFYPSTIESRSDIINSHTPSQHSRPRSSSYFTA